MELNDAGQEVKGGIPQTRLTPADIITYWGFIVASSTSGDLATWDGDSNTIQLFTANNDGSGTYDYSDFIEDDLEGRSVSEVAELAKDSML